MYSLKIIINNDFEMKTDNTIYTGITLFLCPINPISQRCSKTPSFELTVLGWGKYSCMPLGIPQKNFIIKQQVK